LVHFCFLLWLSAFPISAFPISIFSFFWRHFVPVNSQARFRLARDLLVAYLFCWRTPHRNPENRKWKAAQ
jgi:hypothetical protein